VHRSQMSSKERTTRSRIAKLIHYAPIMRATVSVRRVTCGKPNCRCAAGERHLAVYITSRKGGARRQLFIPREKEEEVRSWVGNYHRVCELLDELSELFWERVTKEK
jgi:predicted Zn-dependent protease